MVRTMRTLLFLAQLPDLASCDPDDLRLGAGYKREHKDIIKIRHIASNLDLLKKTPCSAVFYPPANAGNLAPKLLTLPECKEKLKEMHDEFLAYDGLVAALLGKPPMWVRKRRRKYGIGCSGIHSVYMHDALLAECTHPHYAFTSGLPAILRYDPKPGSIALFAGENGPPPLRKGGALVQGAR